VEKLNHKLGEYGLIDISTMDPTIKIELRYASGNNFMKRNMYGCLKNAYLAPELAGRVVKAQHKLKEYNEYLSLVILDAARPLSIQRIMYDTVKGPDKDIYVADPDSNGGFHNYGIAVDLTITDIRTGDLDMGSEFDFFGEESHVGIEIDLYKNGKITLEDVKNRYFLYSLMLEQQLFPLANEWWHYQYHTEETDKQNFRLMDF